MDMYDPRESVYFAVKRIAILIYHFVVTTFSRNAAERTMPASNLYLAKVCYNLLSAETFVQIRLWISDSVSSRTQTWFHSSQPMTRSRSSELRY
jgi:hypothetical protein